MFPILLKKLYKITPWCKDLGEEFLLSDKEGFSNVAQNGRLSSMPLNEALDSINRKDFLGTDAFIPLKARIVDTERRMPVEVYDKSAFSSYELVYILEAADNAKMLYGFKDLITERDLREKLKLNRLADICNIISVNAGDVYTIPAGTPWALGEDIKALIIDAADSKKYRLFDYGRSYEGMGALKLETELAIKSLVLSPPKQKSISLGDMTLYPFGLVKELSENGPYLCELLTLDGNAGIYNQNGFIWLYCLSGDTVLSYPSGNMRLKKGVSLLIPKGMKTRLTGSGKFITVNL